jgi:hypothetical protein
MHTSGKQTDNHPLAPAELVLHHQTHEQGERLFALLAAWL